MICGKPFSKGDATMMLVLFDNTTSSDESMDAVSEMRKIANEQCFISGMTGVVADIKNLALKELPIYVVIAAPFKSDCFGTDFGFFRCSDLVPSEYRTGDSL